MSNAYGGIGFCKEEAKTFAQLLLHWDYGMNNDRPIKIPFLWRHKFPLGCDGHVSKFPIQFLYYPWWNQKNQTKIVWWTLVTLLIKLIRILLKWKYLCHFSHHVVEREAFCIKKVSPRIPGLEYSCGKIFVPFAKISVAKTENLVTGVARLLVWTRRKFLRRKDWRSESLKPSQSGWPCSYEKAGATAPFPRE